MADMETIDRYTGPPNPEAFLEDLLLWRPPLPVDQADFSGLFEINPDPDVVAQAAGYAWERIPRWISEIDETLKIPSDKPVVGIDFCSSVAIQSQEFRALEFKGSGNLTRELTPALFRTELFGLFEDPDMRLIHTGATVNSAVHRLLDAAVQKVLFQLNSYDVANYDREVALPRLEARFREVMAEQSASYIMEEASPKNIETRWGIHFESVDEGQTYLETLAGLPHRTEVALQAAKRLEVANRELKVELESIRRLNRNGELTRKQAREAKHKANERSLERNQSDMAQERECEPIGMEVAQAYIDWQASELASWVAGDNSYRIARFLSVDIGARGKMANSSLVLTSPQTRETNLYSHAVKSLFDPHQHIAQDMFEPLNVPDDSVTFITCYDGWPFCTSFEDHDDRGDSLSYEEKEAAVFVAANLLINLYQKLTPGGKIIIFPWATNDNTYESVKKLRDVAGLVGNRIGHGVGHTLFHVATLVQLMTDSERSLNDDQSSIFRDNESDVIDALIIQKPYKKALIERHVEALGERILIAANRTRDSLDPTQ